MAIGLDIGGTKIAAGVVSATGEIIERSTYPTPADDSAAIVDTIERLIQSLRERHSKVQAIGVGVAGWVEWPDGCIRFAPYLAPRCLPLRTMLEAATGLPVVVDNDANAAAWAEIRFGAGVGVSQLLLLTLGTGIGGGLVVDGEIRRGATGSCGEVGHLIVDPYGEQCGCGNQGCLEAAASGTALTREGRRLATADPDGTLAQLAGGVEGVTSRLVHQAALAGDAAALKLLHQIGFWLGIGTASLVNVLDPALVVVTGGLIDIGAPLFDSMQASFDRHLYACTLRRPPPIVRSSLGTDAGLIGAASLALQYTTED